MHAYFQLTYRAPVGQQNHAHKRLQFSARCTLGIVGAYDTPQEDGRTAAYMSAHSVPTSLLVNLI